MMKRKRKTTRVMESVKIQAAEISGNESANKPLPPHVPPLIIILIKEKVEVEGQIQKKKERQKVLEKVGIITITTITIKPKMIVRANLLLMEMQQRMKKLALRQKQMMRNQT